MRAKSCPLHHKVGSRKLAKNRCEICDYATDADVFTSTLTGGSFEINHQLNCDERCIMHLLTCKQCQNQYTEEITDDFRYRWNTYKSSCREFYRKESYMLEYLYIHFSSDLHFNSTL